MAEHQRRQSMLKDKKLRKKSKCWSSQKKPQINTLGSLSGSMEDNNLTFVAMDSKNILVSESHHLHLFAKSPGELVKTLEFNFPTEDLTALPIREQGEYTLFKHEQNHLEVVDIKCNTVEKHRNFVFTSKIKDAVAHPSGDFIIILDDQGRLGIFDLLQVMPKCSNYKEQVLFFETEEKAVQADHIWVHPDGRLVFGFTKKTLQVSDLKTGQVIQSRYNKGD